MKKFAPLLLLGFVVCLSSFAQNARTTITLTAKTTSVTNYTDKEVIINGKSDLHLTSSTLPLSNSLVRINSENSWLFFDNIKPSDVISTYLSSIFVGDQQAINKSNVRVAIYKNGTVVMPHPPTYHPLTVYTGQNYTGDSASYFTLYNKYTTLSGFDNNIRSFKLKRGYMASFATSSDGSGYSRVYIANDDDLLIPVLPIELNKMISFIRIFNWEYVSKKGWCGTGSGSAVNANQVNATWFYSWSADQASTSTLEYVPIRQNGGWPGWTEISGKQGVTHVLGFNEPDHTEQSNLTVAQAVAQWPEMMKTGLRIGSPACTNFSWLYQFMDSCKARNYRVDYVAIHAYWGGKSAQNWYNDLKYIHDRTGRPIWITEWNNGANWTTEWWPTDSLAQLSKQLSDIKGILTVLDTAHFIERYSIYNWVENKRAMILNGTLTPAGQYYASDKSDIAFKRINEVIPTYTFKRKPSLGIAFGSKTLTLTITDPNGEYCQGYILEKQVGNGDFSVVYESEDPTSRTYSDTLNLTLANKIRYRVRTKLADSTLSEYSNEIGYDTSEGSTFQYGLVNVFNVGWNSIYFKQPYASFPTIIVGSPTNKNSSIQFCSRAKLISYTSRFNLQIIPWSYQNVSSISQAETVPYIVTAPGNYDFDGLKAEAGKSTVSGSWSQVTFKVPFDTIPVVFVTGVTSPTTYAVTARVRNVTKTGFEVKRLKESAITTILPSEYVAYFAITPGTGAVNNKKLIVGKTSNNAISAVYNTINYGDSLATPLFIAQMQTCNDDTVAATLRSLLISNKYANVMKQRERSCGVVTMSRETGGWMAIDTASYIPTSINNQVVREALSFYPNPASDKLYLNDSFPGGLAIDVYNLFGMLVKRTVIFGNQLDISDIPAGYYLLKTPLHKAAKFVKL